MKILDGWLPEEEADLREALETLAILPEIFPQWAKWRNTYLVTDSQFRRLNELIRADHRSAIGQGSYFNCWVVWLGPKRKTSRARCGARTRKGTPCRCLPEKGKKRCKLHGGRSTGPRTAAGRAAIAESNRRRAMLRKSETTV